MKVSGALLCVLITWTVIGCAQDGDISKSGDSETFSETQSEIIGCAQSDGWPCDDGNKCTLDQCVDNVCVNSPPSSNCFTNEWYVAPPPLGSAAGTGSKTAPWTLAHAGSLTCANGQIHAGDTVNIAGGTYAGLTEIKCNNGASMQPITYISAVQHRAVLDGTLPAFALPNAWEPVPGQQQPGKNIYRSVATYPSGTYGSIFGGFINLNGTWMSLVVHYSSKAGMPAPLDYLSSDTHQFAANQARYIGPGIAYNATDSKIYIRLDNSTAQAGRPVPQINNPDGTPKPNPNEHQIRIAPVNVASAKCLKITGSHLVVDGLTLTTCNEAINTVHTQPVTDLTLRDLDVTPIYVGGALGSADHVTIENSKFHARMPALQFSASDSDMHGYDAPAGYNEKKCIRLGSAHHVNLLGNEFDEFVDCLSAVGASDVVVRNNIFRQIWDDGWQMRRDEHHIDIGYNVFFGAGISRDNSRSDVMMGANSGTVWIHHNIFAPHERQVWWFRPGYPNVPGDPTQFGFGMGDGIPLSSHLPLGAASYAFSWKLYHNTFYVVQPRPGAQASIGTIGPLQPLLTSESPHEVYNNVFIDASATGLATMYTQGRPGPNGTTIARESYDGNVFSGWSTLYNRITTTAAQYSPVVSPEALLTYPAIVADTTAYAIPSFANPPSQGWEKRGFTHPLAGAPLDSCFRPASCFASGVPDKNCATGAISLVGTGWPDTNNDQPWRGAVAPGGCVQASPY